MKLSRASFTRAREYMRAAARPLDRALFEFRFEQGPAGRVLAELAAFQNPDGGFGRALEADARTPSSSSLATGIALKILQEMDAPAASPLVADAVRFLLDTYNPQDHVWRPTALDTNAYPHAPWWHDENGSLARTFGGFLIIPRAELVALLSNWRALVPSEWLDDLAACTVRDIEAEEQLGTGGGSDFEYALDLAQARALPESLRARLVTRLGRVVASIRCDSASWDSYGVTPLRFAPAPSSPFAGLLEKEVDEYLDYLIAHQCQDGAWEPNWTWGSFYPEAWEQARQDWRSRLTLEHLTTLRSYGRIQS